MVLLTMRRSLPVPHGAPRPCATRRVLYADTYSKGSLRAVLYVVCVRNHRILRRREPGLRLDLEWKAFEVQWFEAILLERHVFGDLQRGECLLLSNMNYA